MTLELTICAIVTYIITVIGLVLNGLFALFMLLPIHYSRRSPIRMLTSRLWLTFGILIAQTIQLLLTSSNVVLITSGQIHRNRPLCILVSCVPESLDFIVNLMITLLSFNLLIVIKNPRSNSTRKFTNLLTCASLVAWIIGFVLAFSMTAPFVNTDSGWCDGTLPLYMSLIRSFIDFLVPYICSITALRFTLKAWYGRKRGNIMETEISDSPDRGQATKGKIIVPDEILDEADDTKTRVAHHQGQILTIASTPSCSKTDDVRLVKTDPGKSVDTNKGRDFNIQARNDTNHRQIENFYAEETDVQFDFNKPVTEGASRTSDLSGLHKESSREKSIELCKPVTEGETRQIKIDSCHTEDASGNLELENLSWRSLRMWILFNALIVLFGFLSRILLRLPIADMLNNTTTGYYTYICVAALLYSVNLACVPLLCIIVCEVRHAFNPRICKLCLKISCWGCDCCIEVDKEKQ